MAIKGPSKSGQPGSISKRKVKIALNGGRWKEKEEFRNHPPVESFFLQRFVWSALANFQRATEKKVAQLHSYFHPLLFHLYSIYFFYISLSFSLSTVLHATVSILHKDTVTAIEIMISSIDYQIYIYVQQFYFSFLQLLISSSRSSSDSSHSFS